MNWALLSGRYLVYSCCCGKSSPAGTSALAVEPEGCEGGFGTQHLSDIHLERRHGERCPPCVSSNMH